MRLNFYSRRRRFNKSLLGSHKNSFTPFIHKKALRFKNGKAIAKSGRRQAPTGRGATERRQAPTERGAVRG